ncbi:Glutaminyl-peptide cyclotransferase [Zancudomyces culisetae]|uniref:Peptide hydrolase n=1 Tax=Zancudomyces culisetae TaxID=1213189 RepID=A0A1R1PFH1_ZANCU|nr:Glutaminyl-peptide cyclotransferase [Zancudomyces culisetae]|eukprot:OMH79750.1 Glutaminyl-peptide cyclotransferase [Zancudomyces culisetae]
MYFFAVALLISFYFVARGLTANSTSRDARISLSVGERMTDHELQKIYSDAKRDFNRLDKNGGSILGPMLVKRDVGSDGHKKVQRFIADTLRDSGFMVTFDNFTEQTPYGMKEFSNIIGIKTPAAKKRLLMAAHYDSKYFKEFDFIGATDSSVPVALLLDLCKSVGPKLSTNPDDTTLQLVFFDGEEAFKDWTSTDSLYGARHLAEKWDKELEISTKNALPGLSTSEIKLIDLFVLLDLIGAPNPTFLPLIPETKNVFYELAALENRLYTKGFVSQKYLRPRSTIGVSGISDDHEPFLKKSVKILHLIATPFPDVWHKQGDNAQNLDQAVINNFAVLMRTFVFSYLNLAP